MVEGVSKGYEKKLEIVGVGYIAAIQKNTLQLRVGFANELQLPIPAGLNVLCPDQTHIVIKGIDKHLVGQFAAEIRSRRKPEPYKGKGIRYSDEQVRRKDGKTVQYKKHSHPCQPPIHENYAMSAFARRFPGLRSAHVLLSIFRDSTSPPR
jgi:hypothetical protein